VNVLVIAEDFRKDQYILRPVVQAMMAAVGKPRASVIVMTRPLLRGVAQVLDVGTLRDRVLAAYPMVHLFLLIVDRDADPNRRRALGSLEERLRGSLKPGSCFIAQCAWQELEVWALAGSRLPADWKWAEVRAEAHPKEVYFAPFVKGSGALGPDGGRAALGEEAAARLKRVAQRCPEVAHLQARVSRFANEGLCEGAPFDG
jgi:hypothetical protein